MKFTDNHNSTIILYQAKNGKIILPFGSIYFTLSKEDADKVKDYGLEDFNIDDYNKAYK